MDPLHDPGGHDSDDAGMPSLGSQDDPEVPLRVVLLGQEVEGLTQDPSVHLPAATVRLFEVPGQLRGLRRILGEEEAERRFGLADPPGGVDTGGQNEADPTRVHLGGVDTRALEEGPEAGLRRPAERLQTVAHQGPVLAAQRHQIGHGGQSHQVQVGMELLHVRSPLPGQELAELVGHPRPGEGVGASGAVLPGGVHHRPGGGELVAGRVVVGDDHVEAQLAGPPQGVVGPDPTIHRHHDPRTGLSGRRQAGVAEVVAVAQPARDEGHDPAAQAPEPAGQEGSARDSVHVVVPVDQDRLLPVQGEGEPFPGRRHSRERGRIAQAGEERSEKGLGSLGLRMAADGQEPADGGRKGELLLETCDEAGVRVRGPGPVRLGRGR